MIVTGKLLFGSTFLTILSVIMASQYTINVPNSAAEPRPVITAGNGIHENEDFSGVKEHLLTRGRMMAYGHVTLPSARACPCANQSWCQIIRHIPRHEIFIFSIHNTNWRHYDWSRITTLATFTYFDDDVMCFAHSKGIRVVHGADFPKDQLVNKTARYLWVNATINTMTYHFLDGVNVDFEQGINDKEVAQRQGLTLLMKELNEAAKQLSPYTQITFDFASTPDAGYRRYDYKGIADIVDFAFVMDYDEDGGKYASANSPFDRTKHGMERFMELGIPSDKLILGAPWYGYWHLCNSYNKMNHLCKTKQDGQINYPRILKIKDEYSFTGRLWDPVAKSPFFAATDPISGAIYQIWYDDPQSLAIKFQLVPSLHLRGAGNWQADALNYGDPKEVAEMWGAFPF